MRRGKFLFLPILFFLFLFLFSLTVHSAITDYTDDVVLDEYYSLEGSFNVEENLVEAFGLDGVNMTECQDSFSQYPKDVDGISGLWHRLALFNFENETVGETAFGGWELSAPAGISFTVLNDYEGMVHPVDFSDQSTNYGSMRTTYAEQSTQVLEMCFIMGQDDARWDVVVEDGYYTTSLYLEISSDGYIKYQDGSTHSITTYEADTFYFMRLVMEAGVGWYMELNGVRFPDTDYYGFKGSPTAFDVLRMASYTTGNYGHMYITSVDFDWVDDYWSERSADVTGWMHPDVDDLDQARAYVTEEFQGVVDVVHFYDSSDTIWNYMTYEFDYAYPEVTVEFLLSIDTCADPFSDWCDFRMNVTSATNYEGNIWLTVWGDPTPLTLWIYNGSWCDTGFELTPEKWQHWKLKAFEKCFEVWVDGELALNRTYITRGYGFQDFTVGTSHTHDDYDVYLDSLDVSYAIGYVEGRIAEWDELEERSYTRYYHLSGTDAYYTLQSVEYLKSNVAGIDISVYDSSDNVSFSTVFAHLESDLIEYKQEVDEYLKIVVTFDPYTGKRWFKDLVLVYSNYEDVGDVSADVFGKLLPVITFGLITLAPTLTIRQTIKGDMRDPVALLFFLIFSTVGYIGGIIPQAVFFVLVIITVVLLVLKYRRRW